MRRITIAVSQSVITDTAGVVESVLSRRHEKALTERGFPHEIVALAQISGFGIFGVGMELILSSPTTITRFALRKRVAEQLSNLQTYYQLPKLVAQSAALIAYHLDTLWPVLSKEYSRRRKFGKVLAPEARTLFFRYDYLRGRLAELLSILAVLRRGDSAVDVEPDLARAREILSAAVEEYRVFTRATNSSKFSPELREFLDQVRNFEIIGALKKHTGERELTDEAVREWLMDVFGMERDLFLQEVSTNLLALNALEPELRAALWDNRFPDDGPKAIGAALSLVRVHVHGVASALALAL